MYTNIFYTNVTYTSISSTKIIFCIYFEHKDCVKKYYVHKYSIYCIENHVHKYVVYRCYVCKFYNKNILLPTSSLAKTRGGEVAA